MSNLGADYPAERVYKSLWHVALALIGLYEFKTHKTKVGKVLAAGMLAFHVDAAIADALDTKCLSRRILEGAIGAKEEDAPSDSPSVLRRDEPDAPARARKKVRK